MRHLAESPLRMIWREGVSASSIRSLALVTFALVRSA